jgi:hypothetical protein
MRTPERSRPKIASLNHKTLPKSCTGRVCDSNGLSHRGNWLTRIRALPSSETKAQDNQKHTKNQGIGCNRPENGEPYGRWLKEQEVAQPYYLTPSFMAALTFTRFSARCVSFLSVAFSSSSVLLKSSTAFRYPNCLAWARAVP